MKKSLTVGCVIMASGLSRRFGANKLLADFCGQPMLCRAFAATATPCPAAMIPFGWGFRRCWSSCRN